MAINLSKLNISLDTFNAESSGTYNIGQMKLSSDGKSVYRTNNHKTFTILNRTEISSEEALAVKFAFCRALSKEGLSQDAINAVKQKLGIPGNASDALKAGSQRPVRCQAEDHGEQGGRKPAGHSAFRRECRKHHVVREEARQGNDDEAEQPNGVCREGQGTGTALDDYGPCHVQTSGKRQCPC